MSNEAICETQEIGHKAKREIEETRVEMFVTIRRRDEAEPRLSDFISVFSGKSYDLYETSS